MNNKPLESDWLKHEKEEEEIFKTMSCSELLSYLNQHWETLLDGPQIYLAGLAIDKGCQEVAPYLLRCLKNTDPYNRWRALSGLGELGCREYRSLFIDLHLNDSDDVVRQKALLHLSELFRSERDREILQLALSAWDNPNSSIAMRLTAGAVMMYQLDIPHDEQGAPAWWDEEEEDLQHPFILRAVEETRETLLQAT
ncbi:hypothetical protein TFLX_00747 [Thermoflexales bacterium]|nr:hypothetical protein TFLX_00747 [Thermoflexales bacterium]